MEMFTMSAWLVPVFPLMAFIIQLSLGRGFRTGGIWAGCLGSLCSLIMSLLICLERLSPDTVDYSYSLDWVRFGQYSLKVGFEVTNMTAGLLAAVTLLCCFIHLAAAFRRGKDERVTVLFSYLSLFQFAMLGLLLSGDLLTLFLFWELAAAGAFLLIGYSYTQETAVKSAQGMLIATQAGGAILLLAIVMLFWLMPDHALDFASMHNALQDHTGSISGWRSTFIAVLLLIGAALQGALLPFHLWSTTALSDRSPSSFLPAIALPAGAVYLVARTAELFAASEAAMLLTALIGGLTALLAAAIALAQTDSWKSLAYIAVSQNGFAFMALGLGSVTGGLFYAGGALLGMILLRLVMLQGNRDSFSRKPAAWLGGLGVIAAAGFPPFIGFWSSTLIIKTAYAGSFLWFALAMAALLLKAAAIARLGLAAAGYGQASSGRLSAGHSDTQGITALVAVLCLAAGFVQTPWNSWLAVWLSGEQEPSTGYLAAAAVTLAAVLLGLWLGYALRRRTAKRAPHRDTAPSWPIRLLQNEFYIPAIYRYIAEVPLRAVGRALQAFDDCIVGRRFW